MEPAEDGYLEKKKLRSIQHFLPIKEPIPEKDCLPEDDPLYPLCNYLYQKTKLLYSKTPLRKNGENPFLHPLNVVRSLRKAKIKCGVTICVGLCHDFVEEMVDIYERENNVKEDKEGILLLDAYEEQVFKELDQEMRTFCEKNNVNIDVVDQIIDTLHVLTRHKRHYYYKSLSAIFTCKDPEVRERAIQVKLADMLHNVQCLECFDESGRLYRGFKSLFVLNNAKKFILDKYGGELFTSNNFPPTRRLFSKCAKATFDALLRICISNKDKGIKNVLYILQLAFKKYVFVQSGISVVTEPDMKELHPMRLYQGIVLKYDHRLHQELDKFDDRMETELAYCKKFFSDFNFGPVQFQAIMDYKDAYGMREVIARLLYQPDYYISRFICSELSVRGRIKKG
jgi:hypothetical protein